MKLSRSTARRLIVRRANEARSDPGVIKPDSMRRIQDAVCVVRRRRLVKPAVLEAAGYRR